MNRLGWLLIRGNVKGWMVAPLNLQIGKKAKLFFWDFFYSLGVSYKLPFIYIL